MKKQLVWVSLILLVLLVTSGCGLTMKHSTIALKQNLVVNNYDAIRTIVIEEAKNNGFSNLTEVKPSKYNDYEGKLNFITDADIFKVEIKKDGENFSLYMHGGATSGNLDGAIKAITARVSEI